MQSSEWCFTEVYEDLCLRFLELHETEQAGALYNLPWRSLEFLPATATLARKPSTEAPVAEILQASLSPAMLQAKRGFMRFRLISLTLGPPEWKEEKEPVLKTSCWRFPDASNCHIFPKTIKHMSQGISLVHCNKFRVTAAGALPGDSANGNTRQYDRFLSNGRLVLQQNLHRRSDAFAFRWSCQELSTNHDFWVLD